MKLIKEKKKKKKKRRKKKKKKNYSNLDADRSDGLKAKKNKGTNEWKKARQVNLNYTEKKDRQKKKFRVSSNLFDFFFSDSLFW